MLENDPFNHSKLENVREGVWKYEEIVGVYDNKQLLSEKALKLLEFKSKVISKKLCYTISTAGSRYIAYLLEDEAGFKTYIQYDFIEYVENFVGAKWYLVSSHYGDIKHGDGGFLCAKYGKKLILVAPLEYMDMRYQTDIKKCQRGCFEKIIEDMYNYMECYGESSVLLIEKLKLVMDVE